MSDFNPKRNSIAFRISREMAIDYGMVEPTPAESAERDEQLRRFREKQAAERKKWTGETIPALRMTDQLTRRILDLHAPDLEAGWTPQCPGCDFGGYDGEPPEWPCRTIVALAEHHGIALPGHSMPGAEYEKEEA